jgi:hypothetical protein
MLAVTQDRRIIANSNTFVSDPIYFAQGYEARYGMMQGLATTFKEITRRIDVSSSELSHRVVLMANTFSGTNSGHDLGIKLSILSAMSKLGILANRARDYDAGTKLMLCTDDLKFPRVMELVELFVPHYAWVVVEEEQLYRVSEMLVVDVNNVNIIAEPNNGLAGIVDEIVVRSAFYLIGRGVRLESLEGRSVILIKQRKHTSIRVEDAFYGNEFMQHAESLGWIIIDPETLDMRYIVHLLSYAQRIVVSYGAIMWTHMAFFNQEATVKYLQCDPNAKPYFPVASHKRLLVHCVSSDKQTSTKKTVSLVCFVDSNISLCPGYQNLHKATRGPQSKTVDLFEKNWTDTPTKTKTMKLLPPTRLAFLQFPTQMPFRVETLESSCM